MPEVSIYVDRKVTVWTREHVTIEVDSEDPEEQKKEIVKFVNEEDIATCDDHSCEHLYDTEEELTPQENDGQSTIEIYMRPNGLRGEGKKIWENGGEYLKAMQEERRNDTKEYGGER